MRRLALLALLLAASCVLAAPAPLPKPQRKPEPPPPKKAGVDDINPSEELVIIVLPLGVPNAPPQPPDADPPG